MVPLVLTIGMIGNSSQAVTRSITVMEEWAGYQAINIQMRRGRALVWISMALGAFASQFPSSSSLEASRTLSAFPLVVGIPLEECFLILTHSGEGQGGTRSVLSQRKQVYILYGSLRKLYILRSLEILTSWGIWGTMSNNSEPLPNKHPTMAD